MSQANPDLPTLSSESRQVEIRHSVARRGSRVSWLVGMPLPFAHFACWTLMLQSIALSLVCDLLLRIL
jgi:hypothetical protein